MGLPALFSRAFYSRYCRLLAHFRPPPSPPLTPIVVSLFHCRLFSASLFGVSCLQNISQQLFLSLLSLLPYRASSRIMATDVITRENFIQMYPSVKEKIDSASFISIDEEMSGIMSPDWQQRNKKHDDPEGERYFNPNPIP